MPTSEPSPVGLAVAAAARSLVGTRFHHQGRNPDHGLDCSGVVLVAARRGAGYVPAERPRENYPRMVAGGVAAEMRAFLRRNFRVIPLGEARAGDIMLFFLAQRGVGSHAAVLTAPNAMVHAYEDYGRVVENEIGEHWGRRRVEAYRIPGA